MTYARQTADGLSELVPGATIESTHTYQVNGQDITEPVQFSFETMALWSDEERAEHGIYTVVDDVVPAGKITTGSTLELADGIVHRHWTLADAPAPAVPQINRLQALLWLAPHGKGDADVRSLIASVPDATQRLIASAYWDASPVYKHDDPFITMLWAGLGIDVPVEQAFAEAAAA
jgi:hypothetical protein